VLDHIPIYIESDDIIVGQFASRPGALELTCLWSTWPDAEIDALQAAGFTVNDEDRGEIRRMNDYWRTRSLTARMTSLYDDERLWPYAQLGVVLPPFRSKEEGWGPGGMIGCGFGIHHEISQIIGVFQYEKVLNRGLNAIVAEAEQELASTRLTSAEAIEKSDLLHAIVIANKAVVRFAGRYADLAAELAGNENDPSRRAELENIAAICRRVPGEPARTFHEAMQALWFTVLVLLPAGILSFGRFDQYMYPFYEADKKAGRITDADVLEFLQWLRIKDSQIVITAGQTHRSKYGGFAKWHNWVIGGLRPDGSDATNELSYLALRAAKECPTPPPTLTLRVHDDTPEPLMTAALDLIRTGIGIPAMLSDKSCISFLTRNGIAIDEARDYAVAGCLGVNVPGRSRSVAWPMFVVPLVFQFALNDGIDPRTGRRVGPATGRFEDFATFEAFCAAFKRQLSHFIGLHAEFNNITIFAYGERYPQPIESSLTEGGLQASKNVLGRTLPLENGSVLNPIGMINVADSLTAIRKLVFEDRVVGAKELKAALDSDWSGESGAKLRKLALAAPKYGNDDDGADAMAADLYRFWAEETVKLGTSYGGKQKPASITIGTCNWPGGAQTGATPDGRAAGECLADESLTPMRGRDHAGVAAVLRSAAKVDQEPWQAMSLDLRFHPQALDSDDKLAAASRMIQAYFASGGKHVQFNVVSNDILRAAQREPEKHRDLIVRIGGCSAYFAQLPRPVQDEIISRTEFRQIELP
jgi:formate C-acetyltransferase